MTAELPLERYQKYPGDDKALLGFNFRRYCGPGVTVVSETFAIEVVSGVGAVSGDIVVSGPSRLGTRSQAYFSGGVAGALYKIITKVNLSDGQEPREMHTLLYILTV